MIPSEQRQIVEALRTDYSVRQIYETLGFNKSTFYYQPKVDASEEVLRTEIEVLAARYPTYGYRRITKLLLRMGYTVGYRRVARLMKSTNLSVSVKRIYQPRSRLGRCLLGATDFRSLKSPDAIRSGVAILLMSGSKDTSSMGFPCSWMSSHV